MPKATGLMDALAHMNQKKIQIWRITEEQRIEPIHTIGGHENWPLIHLLHRQNADSEYDHFNRLNPITGDSAAQRSGVRPTVPQKRPLPQPPVKKEASPVQEPGFDVVYQWTGDPSWPTLTLLMNSEGTHLEVLEEDPARENIKAKKEEILKESNRSIDLDVRVPLGTIRSLAQQLQELPKLFQAVDDKLRSEGVLSPTEEGDKLSSNRKEKLTVQEQGEVDLIVAELAAIEKGLDAIATKKPGAKRGPVRKQAAKQKVEKQESTNNPLPSIYEMAEAQLDEQQQSWQRYQETLMFLEERRQHIESLIAKRSWTDTAVDYLVGLKDAVVDVAVDIKNHPIQYGVAAAETLPFGVGTAVTAGREGYEVYQGDHSLVQGAGNLTTEGAIGYFGGKFVKGGYKFGRHMVSKIYQKTTERAVLKTTEKVAEKSAGRLGNKAKEQLRSQFTHPEEYSNSVANALRLRTTLTFQQKGILNAEGKLTARAIEKADVIILKDTVIGNPQVVKVLTKDGGKITDWNKFKTEAVRMSNGQWREIHFYKNTKTGKIDYSTLDYKVKGEIKQ